MLWRSSVAFITFLTLFAAHATTMETQIVSIDAPQNARVMIFAQADGRVLWADVRNTAMLDTFKTALAQNRLVRVNFEEEHGNVQSVKLLGQAAAPMLPNASMMPKDAPYPTVLPNMGQAQTLFNTMDNATKDESQCYNRAHGWAYDMFTQYNIYSIKIFIFYTKRYIREYDYKWWFHTTPGVLLSTNQGITEMVMDRSFTTGPVTVKGWTDIFMKNGAFCPTVNRYSDYEQHQEDQYCYLMKASMYYRQPIDMKNLEDGIYRWGWNMQELRMGRQQAFIHWDRYNP